MRIEFILLFILLNLCIINILLLDLLTLVTQLNTNFIITINQNLNQDKNYEVNCFLNCELEINKITYFYNNISQFKDVYNMLPIKIQKIKNTECLILYINKPIINNQYNKTNMIKDKRIFSFNHDNSCNWYINDMSASLWPKLN